MSLRSLSGLRTFEVGRGHATAEGLSYLLLLRVECSACTWHADPGSPVAAGTDIHNLGLVPDCEAPTMTCSREDSDRES